MRLQMMRLPLRLLLLMSWLLLWLPLQLLLPLQQRAAHLLRLRLRLLLMRHYLKTHPMRLQRLPLLQQPMPHLM